MSSRKTVLAGFTTVADLGAANDSIFALRDAIRSGALVGPRILASGSALTPTGGHGDVQRQLRHDYCRKTSPGRIGRRGTGHSRLEEAGPFQQ